MTYNMHYYTSVVLELPGCMQSGWLRTSTGPMLAATTGTVAGGLLGNTAMSRAFNPRRVCGNCRAVVVHRTDSSSIHRGPEVDHPHYTVLINTNV